ncbi:hypothetical protein OA385_02800 [Paracoccaceae bacterium]|nr:hypothetical protein [Paracoccaceae bacterium]
METLMSNKFIFTASALLLGRTLELTNVTKITIDILTVHSLVSKKMAEVGKSDLIIPTQVSPDSY